MSSLAQMVIRLVAEARQFKADLNDAAQHTQKVAADITQSTGKVQQASAALGDQLGVQRDISEMAGAAVAQMGVLYGSAAVSIGALGYAYVKGSKESDAYTKALVLSGNAAGTTSGQLGTMAANISKVVGTQYAAAEALAKMAQSSGVGSDNLEAFTRSAIKFETVTGVAVSETVKHFNELANSPVAASLKLNGTFNYLTASVYRQINSLQEQGKATEAADLAQKAFANTLDTRSAQMVGQIGTIEAAWKGVWNVVKGAGDAMLNIGRVQPTAMKLAEVSAKIAAARGQDKNRQFSMPWDSSLADLQAEQAILQETVRLEKRGAEAAAERKKQTEAVAEWDKTGLKYLSDKAKMEQDITAAKNLGITAGESEAKIEERIKAIRDSYEKKTPKAGVDQQANAYRALMENINAKVVAQEQELQVGKKLTEADKLYIQLDRLVAEGKIKAKDAYSDATIELIENLRVKELASAAEKEALKVAQAVSKERQQLREKESDGIAAFMAKQTEATHASLAGIEGRVRGLRDEADAALIAQQQHVSMAQAIEMVAIAKLEEAKANKFVEGSEGWKAIEREIAARKELLGLIASKDIREATASALKEAADEAKRSNEDVARSMTDQIMRGGKNAAQYLRDLFRTLVLRPMVQPVASAVTGVLNSALGGSNAVGQVGSSMLTSTIGNSLGLTSSAGLGSLFGSSTAYGAAIGTSSVGAGSQAAMLAAQTGEFGAAGLSATAGAAGGTMATIGAAMPYVAAAVLAYSLLSDGGTKPSIEGGYSTAGDPGTNGKAYVNGLYGGALDGSAKTVVEGMTASYLATVKAAGGKAGTFTASEFTGIDQNGHASAIDMSAFVNGKAVYNRFADLGTNKVGSSDAEVKAALELASQKALIEALKATDMGPVLNDYLAGVTVQGKALADLTAVVSDVTNVGALHAALKGLPFEALTAMSVEATKALAEATGGFDALKNKLGSYLQNFYSDSERAALTTRQVGTELAGLGLSMPTTRAGFRALVDAQDLTTEAGRKNYAVLMNVADAFASVVPVADAAAESVSNAADLEAERTKALSEAKGALQASISAERERIQGLIDADQAVADKVRGVFDLLSSSAAELYGQVDAAAAMSAANGRAYISTTLALMNAGGVMPDQASLQAAIVAARGGLAETRYASKFEADRARLQLAGELSRLKLKTGEQLSTAERQLAVDKEQLSALDKMVNGLDGLKEPVVAIKEAVATWLKLQTGKAGSSGATGSSGSAFVTGAGGSAPAASYAFSKPSLNGGMVPVTDAGEIARLTTIRDAAHGIGADPAALAAAAKESGVSMTELASALGVPLTDARAWFGAAGIPAFAAGGDHAGGLAFAGEFGRELVSMGPARVFNARDTSRILTGEAAAGGGTKEEIAQLRDEAKRVAVANLTIQHKLLKLFDDWDRKGMPATRVTT